MSNTVLAAADRPGVVYEAASDYIPRWRLEEAASQLALSKGGRAMAERLGGLLEDTERALDLPDNRRAVVTLLAGCGDWRATVRVMCRECAGGLQITGDSDEGGES